MPDYAGELPLLRRLAVLLSKQDSLRVPDSVFDCLREWQRLVGWSLGGLGGVTSDFEFAVVVDSGVAVDSGVDLAVDSGVDSVVRTVGEIGSVGIVGEKGVRKSRANRDKTPRHTWLTPYFQAYREVYRLAPMGVTVGRMARTFKDIEMNFPREEVVRRFKVYLTSTPARFYSVEHFCSTFHAWDTRPAGVGRDGKRIPEPLPNETPSNYADRLARLGF